MFLQERYELEDVDFYDDTTRDRTSDYTFTRVVYDRNNNGNQSIAFNTDHYDITVSYGGCYYFIPLTTDSQVELSYISKSPHTNDTGDCGFGLIDRTANKGNSVYTRVNGTRRFTKNSSATYWTHIYNQTGSSLANVEIRHIITVNGLSFTYKAIRTDNETVIWEYSDTFDSNLSGKELGIITGWGSCSHTIKQIKVKALS